MSTFEKVQQWLDRYRNVAFDLIRLYLGVGLFVRGILFFVDSSIYLQLVEPASETWLTSPVVLYLVAAIHLIGGALLTVGLYTRLAALVQIPVLAGAVFVVHVQGGLMTASQSFEFSALVLFLLVLVFLHGSERWALDARREDRNGLFPTLNRNLDGWMGSHRDATMSLVRIYLGIGLFVRGAFFIADSSSFLELISDSSGAWLTSVMLAHFVTLVHLFGGALMAIGLLTRLAALVQIPVLAGAVFVVHLQGGLMTASQSFEFSALVLFLLIVVFLYGSGQWSVDHYIQKQFEETEAAEAARMAEQRRTRVSQPAPEPSEPFYTVAPGPQTQKTTCPLTKSTCEILSTDPPRDHPEVTAHPQYSLLGAFYFLAGITGPPREVHFTCERCGTTVEKSRSKEDLNKYRYRR